MIDAPTAMTGPPEVWDPGFSRRPSPSPIVALVALVLSVVSSAAVVAGLHSALKIRYTPLANTCTGLDAGAIAALTRSPPPVTAPGRAAQSCDFAVGRSATGTLAVDYTTSALEVRVLYAMDIDPRTDDGERHELPGVGAGAWIAGDGDVGFETCRYAAEAYDVNVVVHLNLELLPAYCEPVAVRSAVAASLRGTLARLA